MKLPGKDGMDAIELDMPLGSIRLPNKAQREIAGDVRRKLREDNLFRSHKIDPITRKRVTYAEYMRSNKPNDPWVTQQSPWGAPLQFPADGDTEPEDKPQEAVVADTAALQKVAAAAPSSTANPASGQQQSTLGQFADHMWNSGRLAWDIATTAAGRAMDSASSVLGIEDGKSKPVEFTTPKNMPAPTPQVSVNPPPIRSVAPVPQQIPNTQIAPVGSSQAQ